MDTSEAIRWLDAVEQAQGGASGPTIKLRAAIVALGEPVSAEICSLPVDAHSRGMFVARLENLGDKSLTAVEVLALLNDCDYLASL